MMGFGRVGLGWGMRWLANVGGYGGILGLQAASRANPYYLHY